jgi:hypothetical protein
MGRVVFFSATIGLIWMISHLFLPLTPPSKSECNALTAFTRFDTTVITIQDSVIHHFPCAHCSGAMRNPTTTASVTHGLFRMPADTESADVESTVAELAKPVFLDLSRITRALCQSTTVLGVSIPLYLVHQSLLC